MSISYSRYAGMTKVYDYTKKPNEGPAFDALLNKRKRTKADEEDAIGVECEDLLTAMRDAYQSDLSNLMSGQPALEKLKLLPRIEREFASTAFLRQYVKRGGLEVFSRWLSRSELGDLPTQNLVKSCVSLIQKLNIELKDIRNSSLARTLSDLKPHVKDPEVLGNIQKLIDRWTRLALDEAAADEPTLNVGHRKVVHVSTEEPRSKNAYKIVTLPTRSVMDFTNAPRSKVGNPEGPASEDPFKRSVKKAKKLLGKPVKKM
eukprot:TRINITY_DN13425_c0_g1_i1.p1 TRINITY_DN13425_c0_g1~~TRINITY_DN13425_c0_g1_i1.p1  ORF type:complete len:260 (+),score=60.26 TRINITY_DN13425_c0_g1_i1:47-826(+)